jgi:competence protein ComEC
VIDLRLAAPVALAWGALALVVGLPRVTALVLGAAALVAAAAVLVATGVFAAPARRRGRARFAALTLILAGLFSVGAGAQGLGWERSDVGRLAEAGGRADVVLGLTEPAKARASPWGGPASVTARGELWLAEAAHGPGIAAVARFSGELPASGSVLVFRARLAVADLGATERVTAQAIDEPVVHAPTGWRGIVLRLRAGLGERADPLLAGIVLGDTSQVDESLDAALKTTSLTHITAVSGAHVAIVLGVALGLAALVGAPRWGAALAGGVTLLSFTALVGPSPSVLRAVLMGGAALTGLAAGKRRLALGALGAAVALVLAADPWLARSYGLTLSALATAALIVVAPPLARWLRRAAPRLPGPLAEAAALSCSAQLACAPVIAVFAGQISLSAVPANVAAAPAIPLATIAGLAALALGPVWAAGADAAAWVGNLAAGWVARVAEWVSAWPGAAVAWPKGAAGLTLAVLATAALVGGAFALRRAPRWVAWAVAACLVAGMVLAGPLRRPLRSALGGGVAADWAVAACDVGQGTAVVLRSGQDAAVMVDVGPAGGGVDRCLDDLGVRRLDAVILTHFHQDHVGGLA